MAFVARLEVVSSFFGQGKWPQIGAVIETLIVEYMCWRFVVGQVVDAQDTCNSWYRATIVDVDRCLKNFKVTIFLSGMS